MTAHTSSQRNAIAARGNVLLEAGAGAGKTSTLVARCLDLILAPNRPVSVDQLLIVTFTEAAATEMRHRLRVALNERHGREPADLPLAEQLALLDQACIGTLHGFCLRLIREHFQELGLDPQVRVLDETEASLIANESVREVLDAAYIGEDESSRCARELIRLHAGSDDGAVSGLIRQAHQFLQTLPDPRRWLDHERERWRHPQPEALADSLLVALNNRKDGWMALLEEQPPENAVASGSRELLASLAPDASRADWAKALNRLASFVDDEHWKRGEKGKFRDPLLPLFEEARFFASCAALSAEGSDPLVGDFHRARPLMLAFIGLVEAFMVGYAARKRQISGLDFSDLEQFSLRLLWTLDGRPSHVAHEWRRRFHHVFVDEYQDINEAQDRIITGLSRDGEEANRFLVGDVKQSIYGFRLARPDIFLRYAKSWRTGSTHAQVLPLADNFRSHEAILHFVNRCFSGVMREDVGGLPYPEAAFLRFGDPEGRRLLTREHDPNPRVELIHRLAGRGGGAGEPDSADEEEPGNAEIEATLAARKLAELRASGFQVFDRKTAVLRPVDWRDMAVLLRATAGKAEIYTRVFARAGIPLVTARRGFFDAIEISDLVSLLMLLDNPLQDIPLLAVLRSPLVGLSPDEMVEVRAAASRESAFWTALLRFSELNPPPASESPPGAAGRVAGFLERFRPWREQARRGSLSQCLEDILESTQYLSWLAGQPRGEEAGRNVQRLLELTREYDSSQGLGLHRFLERVRIVQAEGDGPEPASAADNNAVRLMTIHASKGLEFPVVVLGDLGKRFRADPPAAGILIDDSLGLCPIVFTPDGRQSYPSLALRLADDASRTRNLAEELRLLYVAMTRACDLLVLLGTTPASRPEKHWVAPGDGKLSRRQVLSARSFFDFIGPLLPELCGRPDWFSVEQGASSLVSWRVVSADEPVRFDAVAAPGEPAGTDDSVPDLTELRRHLGYRYPFLEATRRAGKTTVTRLRRQIETLSDDESAGLFGDLEPAGPARRRSSAGQPVDGLNAAQTGIAYHTFFQRLRLELAQDSAGLEGELRRLASAGILSELEAAAIQVGRVQSFWTGPVGGSFLKHRSDIRRELPFTAAFTSRELDSFAGRTGGGGTAESDLIVVQGVADLALIRPNEIWILDFKSDRITADQLTERVAAYRPQVQLYQQALERTCRRPVSRLWLHFLHLDRTVEVNLT